MKRQWKLAVKVLLFLGCMVYLGHSLLSLGFKEVWKVALAADPWWLWVSLVPLYLRFLIWSLKWFLMLSRQKVLPFWAVHRWIMAAAWINLATPTAKIGGAIFRGMVLKREAGFRSSSAYGWVFADQMAHLIGNLLLFGFLGLCTPWILPQLNGGTSLVWVGAASLVVVVTWVLARPWLWRRMKGTQVPEVLRRGTERWLSSYQIVPRSDSMAQFLWPSLASTGGLRVFAVELMGSALSFGMLGLANVWVLRSMGSEASALGILLIVMVAYVAGSSLGIMGGIGVTEVFLMKLYPLAGILPTHAAAAALLHRTLFYLWVLLLGGWALWRMRKNR